MPCCKDEPDCDRQEASDEDASAHQRLSPARRHDLHTS